MKKRRNHNLIFGLVISGFMAALIVMGFFWTPYPPTEMDGALRGAPPSLAHPLGTDNFGRDLFSRIVDGAGTTFVIALVTVAIGAAFGILIGALTGYYGGWVDEVLMRANDAVIAFPSILLALVIIAVTGPGKYNVTIALGILFIPGFARIVRGEYKKQMELDYVRSARLMGVGDLRLMFVHILPNVVPVLLSSAVIGFNNAVLAEASMSYLGIGVQQPDVSLGRMLSDSQTFFFEAPWYPLCTGGAIVLLILGFGLLADGLGDREHA